MKLQNHITHVHMMQKLTVGKKKIKIQKRLKKKRKNDMCGAYGLSVKDAKEVYDRFDIENTLDSFKPRFNIRPGQMNPVITNSGDHNEISLMFWGLLPHWARDEHYKYKTINAKVETVAELPSFREPFRKKRSIISANFFYETDKLHLSKPP